MLQLSGTKTRVLLAAVGFACIAAFRSAHVLAETNVVRLSRQYGLNYLPVIVVIEKGLIEKHARQLGLAPVTVTALQLGGGAASNDAILSGAVDFNATGIGPLITMWAKTAGKLNVKAVMPIAATPTTLVTIDPNVHSLHDYLGNAEGQIALPAPKVSVQARVLQMAAERELGPHETFALDHLTVAMKNPDAFIAMSTGSSSVKSHFAIEPFTMMELKAQGAHAVLSSYDALGGEHTLTLLWTTERFKSENPKVYQAVVDSFMDAMKWINANPREAAEMYMAVARSPLSHEEITQIITDKKRMDYTPVPMRTAEFANFMYKVGAIKRPPSKWQDLFFSNVYDLPGS